MGRSPAPVARGPRAVCSLPATRRALKRRPCHPLPPPDGPSRRAPTSPGARAPRRRVRTRTVPGAAKAPPGPCIPLVSVMGRGAGRVPGAPPSPTGGGGRGRVRSPDLGWRKSPPPAFLIPTPPPTHPGRVKSPERSPRTQGCGGFFPSRHSSPPTLAWARGSGGLTQQSSCLCFIRLY